MKRKPGRKTPVEVGRLRPRGLPAGGPERIIAWVERYCVVPRGHGQGKPFRLREFQREIIRGAYAPGIRQALVSIPRANGKTGLAAVLGVRELFDGPEGAEVLVVASDQRQAMIVYRLARRMVELRPELAARCHVYADRIYVPERDAVLIPLPAEPDALHGHDPTLLIVDELHVVTEEVWEAATTAAGKRPESLTLAISTPSSDRDSVMWRLVEHGRRGDDPAFYFAEYGAPPGADHLDPEVWKAANPALSDPDPFMALDAMTALVRTTRVSTFKRLRLGMWTEEESAWVDWDAWQACADPERQVEPGERVVLAFDGSASGDSTALIGCTLDGHLFTEAVWENPGGDPHWRVPRGDVDRAVDAAFDRFDVLELAADPWGWRSEIESWAERHGERRVIEFATNVISRMAPATDRLYQAVQLGQVTHDGNADLARHVANCAVKSTPQGDCVVKDKRGSPRKIDAAVAAIVAFDRASWHAQNRPRRRVVVHNRRRVA